MESSDTPSDVSSVYSEVFDVDDESTPFSPTSIHTLMRGSTCSESSARVDYMDTLASRPETEWPSKWGTFGSSLHRPSAQNSLERRVHHEEMIAHQIAVNREREEKRRQIEKTVIEVIAIHLLVLCLVHVGLQVTLLVCGRLCPSDAVLHRVELWVVLAFPVFCLLALRLVNQIRDQTWSCAILLLAYSVTFAVFLFSACDLVVGTLPARRDTALMLFTLTVSLFLFSMFAMTNLVSVRQRYLRLALVTLLVNVAIIMPLLLPRTTSGLPRGLQKLLQPDLPSSVVRPIWASNMTALLFVVMSTMIVSALLLTLRQNMYNRSHIAEYVRISTGFAEVSFNAPSVTLQTLVTIELFFIVMPYRLIKVVHKMIRSARRGY